MRARWLARIPQSNRGSMNEAKEMSILLEPQEASVVWEPPATKALDEVVWQAWLKKGRAENRRDSAARVKALTWVSIAALLMAAAGLWSHPGLFDVVVRFIVVAGALVLMAGAFHAKNYPVAALFGALVVLYNPVAPLFGFSGGWQCAVLAASSIPFIASAASRGVRTAH
jgi:hypothetical protein